MSKGRGSAERSAIVALAEMRGTRRRRYVEQLDLLEVLYRVYVGAIFGAIGLALVAGAVNEAPATPAAIDSLRQHGPAVLGLVVALAVLAGLRSGARGGPLAIEAAEVQYVLLAPIDRGATLRPAALRQLRVAVLVGAVLGAVLGNFVFRRLPGSPVEWIACLAAFGALLPLCALAAALLGSGRRLRPWLAAALGLLLVAWSGADLVLGWNSAPTTMLGDLATLPLQSGTPTFLAALGGLLAVALLAAGLLGVGGILLEAARRRAALTAELRFSASVRDLRTVVLLRRQLASERPRRRPWLRLRAAGGAVRYPIWRRGWQSLLRWPLARAVRVALIGVGAGLLAAGAWSGAPLAFILLGPLLFVAALDLIEPLAQEADHPTRRQLLPLEASSLISRQLAVPVVGLTGVILLAALTAGVAGGSATPALGVGAVVAVPLAVVLACCAAFSATADPYANLLSAPEIAYAISAAPLLGAAAAAGVPTLIAHQSALHDGSAFAGAVVGAVVVSMVGAVLVSVLGARFAKRDGQGQDGGAWV
jgi:hypothetical protein